MNESCCLGAAYFFSGVRRASLAVEDPKKERWPSCSGGVVVACAGATAIRFMYYNINHTAHPSCETLHRHTAPQSCGRQHTSIRVGLFLDTATFGYLRQGCRKKTRSANASFNWLLRRLPINVQIVLQRVTLYQYITLGISLYQYITLGISLYPGLTKCNAITFNYFQLLSITFNYFQLLSCVINSFEETIHSFKHRLIA